MARLCVWSFTQNPLVHHSPNIHGWCFSMEVIRSTKGILHPRIVREISTVLTFHSIINPHYVRSWTFGSGLCTDPPPHVSILCSHQLEVLLACRWPNLLGPALVVSHGSVCKQGLHNLWLFQSLTPIRRMSIKVEQWALALPDLPPIKTPGQLSTRIHLRVYLHSSTIILTRKV